MLDVALVVGDSEIVAAGERVPEREVEGLREELALALVDTAAL